MNPKYLWLTGAIQLLTLFVLGPIIAIVIAYAALKEKSQSSPRRYVIACAASGVTAALLLGFAKWINADVRTPQYFVQLASVLVGGLLLGVGMGSLVPVLLHGWRWHKTTQLTDHK